MKYGSSSRVGKVFFNMIDFRLKTKNKHLSEVKTSLESILSIREDKLWKRQFKSMKCGGKVWVYFWWLFSILLYFLMLSFGWAIILVVSLYFDYLLIYSSSYIALDWFIYFLPALSVTLLNYVEPLIVRLLEWCDKYWSASSRLNNLMRFEDLKHFENAIFLRSII